MNALIEEYALMKSIDQKYTVVRYNVKNFSDYENCTEIIKHFLRCSMLNDWSNFDFEAAFQALRIPIYEKLSQHGLIPFDQFLEYEVCMASTREIEELGGRWGLFSDHIQIDGNDIFEAIQKARYEKLRETFLDYEVFQDLIKIVEKIDNVDCNTPLETCIYIFDSCVHAEHVNGNILNDEHGIDIGIIKYEIEFEIE